jgi:hypothetical protein
MAYREVRMWEILEVLRRIGRGENKSEVSRATGRGRRTIRNYVELAEQLGWVAELHEADETLALEVQRSLQPGDSGQKYGPAEALLLPHQATITEWLKIGDA